MTYRILALFATIAAVFFAGCQAAGESHVEDPWGTIRIRPGEAMRVAVVRAGAGTVSAVEGQEQARGAQLAIQNRAPSLGFTLELQEMDIPCIATGQETLASDLAQDPSLVAVLGYTCSQACAAAAPVYDDTHLTLISPGCSATALAEQTLHVGSFMRTIYDDRLEGQLAALFAYEELGARRVAIVDDGSLDTTAVTEAFRLTFNELGGGVVNIQTIPSGELSVRPWLEVIVSYHPDLIYAPLLPGDSVRLMGSIASTGLVGTPLLGGRHYLNTWVIRQTGGSAEGVYAVGPLVDGPDYEELRQAYVREYGSQPLSDDFAFGYDAATLLIDAITEVAVTTSQREMIIGRKALRDALYSTAAHPGLTGNLTCTAQGDCGAGRLAVRQVQSSTWSIVYIP